MSYNETTTNHYEPQWATMSENEQTTVNYNEQQCTS